VKTVGKYAFEGCTSIEKLVLPIGFTSFNSYSIKDCSSLRELTVGMKIYLCDEMGINTTALEKIYYPGSEAQFETYVQYAEDCKSLIDRAEKVYLNSVSTYE
jgi:hypothetical protein